MKIGPLEIHWRRRIYFTRRPDMSEEQLNRAFAVEEKHDMLRAILQVLEEARDLAHDNAAAEIKANNPLLVSAYTGGAEYAKTIKDDILARRALGLKTIEKELAR